MPDLTPPSALMALLDISFDATTPTRVTGSVAADERHHQPWGLVHGGLDTTVIETFATTGAYQAVKDRGQVAVAATNVTDFPRPHRSGRIAVLATAIHQGRGQERWQVKMRRTDDDELVAREQVRLQNLESSE